MRLDFLLRTVHVFQARKLPDLASHCRQMLSDAIVTQTNYFDRDVDCVISRLLRLIFGSLDVIVK